MSCYSIPEYRDVIPTAVPGREIVISREAGLMNLYTTKGGQIERWNVLLLEDVEAREVARRIQQQFPDDQLSCTPLMISLIVSGVVNLILLLLLCLR